MSETTATQTPTPRLKARYNESIKTELTEQFGYQNVMLVPGLTKIVVNMGVGDAARDSKVIDG
ncbi:50S ribosomal protein L5, partial [Brachybacterium alimentarium]